MPCERPLKLINPRYREMTFVELRDFSLKWFGVTEPP